MPALSQQSEPGALPGSFRVNCGLISSPLHFPCRPFWGVAAAKAPRQPEWARSRSEEALNCRFALRRSALLLATALVAAGRARPTRRACSRCEGGRGGEG